MCTVTIVPHLDGFRVACNRDEQRTRPLALPPAARSAGGRTMVYPIDPQSGGTWLGVNDCGLVLALLNGPPDPSLRPPLFSRGVIIPPLLAFGSLSRAVAAASRLDARRFQPFRLVAAQSGSVAVVTGNGRRLSTTLAALDNPRMFTSSSLGNGVVEGPRRRLFEQLVRHAANPLEGQARFHSHRWDGRPDVSVRMARPDAATVSCSQIDVGGERIRFEYTPLESMRRAA